MDVPPSQQYAQYPRWNSRPPGLRFDVIGEAFSQFFRSPGTYILGGLPIILLVLANTVYSDLLQFQQFQHPKQVDPSNPFSAIDLVQLSFAFFVGFVQILGVAGLVHMAIKDARGEPIRPADAFCINGMGFSIIWASILTGLATVFGILLCCLPGFLVASLFLVVPAVIVDKRLGSVAAMAASWDATKPYLWTALGIWIVSILIQILGSCLCIGTIATLPIFAIIIALVYRDLFITPEGTPQPVYSTPEQPYIPPYQV